VKKEDIADESEDDKPLKDEDYVDFEHVDWETFILCLNHCSLKITNFSIYKLKSNNYEKNMITKVICSFPLI
jgi:hypothetical protein